MTDEHRWNLLQRKAQEQRIVRAFDLFRKQDIEPILIKGLAAGRLYPESHIRLSVDMDLAVGAEDFDKATEIATSSAAIGLAIDLHRELRHLDAAPWDDLFASSRMIEVDDHLIRVLRPEDHLRVLCVHWLTDGGSNKDRLWDIYYAVENRGPDFDWDRLLTPVSKRRRRWVICTVGLAHHFLGLDLSGTPIEREALDLPAWLVGTVEREWARETKTLPLEVTVFDPGKFVPQLGRRLRPNPIWATVQMEGSFDAKTRVPYQIANFFKRIMPSYRRVTETIRSRGK